MGGCGGIPSTVRAEAAGGEGEGEEEFRNSGSLATVAAYAYFELKLLLLLATSYRPGWVGWLQRREKGEKRALVTESWRSRPFSRLTRVPRTLLRDDLGGWVLRVCGVVVEDGTAG
jgi:hypothetical protein